MTTQATSHSRWVANRLLCLGFLLLLLETDYAKLHTSFLNDFWLKKESTSLYQSYDPILSGVGVTTIGIRHSLRG